MPADALLIILVVTVGVLAVIAVLLVAALAGRGPLYGRLVEPERRPPAVEAPDEQLQTTVRLVIRERRRENRVDSAVRRSLRPGDDDLDQILAGSLANEAYNRTVRILAWAFIIACLIIVSTTELWTTVRPQIIVVLALGAIFVLVVHELLPPTGLGTARFVLEGSATVVFLTLLVVLTGRANSPFFFIYPLLVGGAALVATPVVTLVLTLEAAAAYGLATLGQPLSATNVEETAARVAVNLTALLLLAYAGMTISRVQRKTRDAAIRLSTVDSLTDLYNRAFFFTALDREIQRSRRFRRDFCLLMMDLDGLKSINDRYGHYHGDLVLRGVAEVIRAGLRSVDVAARYGGDEFVALLPETDPSGAYVVAEKIRQGVSELLVEAAGQQIATSLSIGVVSYPGDGQTADELMIAADEAMYSSKRLGKNRVVGFVDPDEEPAGVGGRRASGAAPTGFHPLPRDREDRGSWNRD